MKIAPRQAEAFLSTPDKGHNAALFYGPDSGLVRERAKRVHATILKEGDDPFALVDTTESALLADSARLADELSAISLMGGKRVIIVREATDKLTAIVESAVEYLNDQAFLVVCSDILGARSSLRAWFEKEPQCAAVACYKDEMRDVQQVVRKLFAEHAIQIDRDAMDYLVGQLGNDRYVTYQELEKLVTYAGESKHLSVKDIHDLVDYNRAFNLDDLVNALADRNVPALEHHLMLHKREGTYPVMYLRAMQRYFNRLYALRAQMSEGMSADAVVKSIKPPVFFKQVPLLTRHLSQWKLDQIVRALELLVSAELLCKTTNMPELAASGRKLLQITQLR